MKYHAQAVQRSGSRIEDVNDPAYGSAIEINDGQSCTRAEALDNLVEYLEEFGPVRVLESGVIESIVDERTVRWTTETDENGDLAVFEVPTTPDFSETTYWAIEEG